MTFAGFIYGLIYLFIGLAVGFFAGSMANSARMQAEAQEASVDEIERFNRRQADWDRVQREVFAYMREKGDEADLEEIQERWGKPGVRAVQELADTLGGIDG